MNRSFNEERVLLSKLKKIGLHVIVNMKNSWKTRKNLNRNRKKTQRLLEVGPGLHRIPGFETCNLIDSGNADYIVDILKSGIFKDNEFDLIYASHIIEHIPWYQTEKLFAEFLRILKPNGVLEIWVPDGLKICKAFVDAEIHGTIDFHGDGWFKFNEKKDPCLWAAGRIFTYGDGNGTTNHPNWHRAIFSERYLKEIFVNSGFRNVQKMAKNEVRGADHGWINLGIKAQK